MHSCVAGDAVRNTNTTHPSEANSPRADESSSLHPGPSLQWQKEKASWTQLLTASAQPSARCSALWVSCPAPHAKAPTPTVKPQLHVKTPTPSPIPTHSLWHMCSGTPCLHPRVASDAVPNGITTLCSSHHNDEDGASADDQPVSQVRTEPCLEHARPTA